MSPTITRKHNIANIETKRQKTSDVWHHGTNRLIDGAWKWCCNYCDQVYTLTVRSGRNLPTFNNAPKARMHLKERHNITSGTKALHEAAKLRRGRPRGSAIWEYGTDDGGDELWRCNACKKTFEHRNHSTIRTHLKSHGIIVNSLAQSNTRRESNQHNTRAAANHETTETTSPSVVLGDPLPSQTDHTESPEYAPSEPEDETEASPKMEESQEPLDQSANIFLADEAAPHNHPRHKAVAQILTPLEPISPACPMATPLSPLRPPTPPAPDPAPMELDKDLDADLLSQFFASLQASVSGGTRAKMGEACKILAEQFYDVEGLQHVDNETWLLLRIPLGIGQRITREAKKWLEERQQKQAIARAVECHTPLPDPVEVQVRRESILSGGHWI